MLPPNRMLLSPFPRFPLSLAPSEAPRRPLRTDSLACRSDCSPHLQISGAVDGTKNHLNAQNVIRSSDLYGNKRGWRLVRLHCPRSSSQAANDFRYRKRPCLICPLSHICTHQYFINRYSPIVDASSFIDGNTMVFAKCYPQDVHPSRRRLRSSSVSKESPKWFPLPRASECLRCSEI